MIWLYLMVMPWSLSGKTGDFMWFNGIYHLNLFMEPVDEQCLEKIALPTPQIDETWNT